MTPVDHRLREVRIRRPERQCDQGCLSEFSASSCSKFCLRGLLFRRNPELAWKKESIQVPKYGH